MLGRAWARPAAVLMAAFGLAGCNEIIGAGEGIPKGEDAPISCTTVDDCLDEVEAPDCRTAVGCEAGTCVFDDAIEGTPVSEQIEGDCASLVCDGQGKTKLTPNPDDGQDDGNPCTIDACDGAKPTHQPATEVPCYTGPKGTADKGICHAGVQHCDAQGQPMGGCEGEQTPVEETCISCLDDDCDGQANEEGEACVCVPGTVQDCYTGPDGTDGVGACHSGKWSCDDCGLEYGTCLGQVTPVAETCDAAETDEDCDGKVNEEGGDCECGDGWLSTGEECDDGNVDGTDACTAVCTIAKCGDGFVQTGTEECDDGNLVSADTCTAGCAIAKCGDAIVQAGVEECDDGGSQDGDKCSATCLEEKVLQVALGGYHSCALLNGGRVKCWGRNNDGQLGLGSTAHQGDSLDEIGANLPAVDLGSGKKAVAIAAGNSHTCALLDDGALKCWGLNDSGQLGLGDYWNKGDEVGEMGDDLPTVDLGTGKTAISVAAGAGHTCAVLNDGTLKCWGGGYYGQLGLGSVVLGDEQNEMGDNLPAVNLGTGKMAVSVTAGDRHTCAALNDGKLKCWGYNYHGQLGLGDTLNRGDWPGLMGDLLPAVNLGAGKTVASVAAGGDHTCAVLNDATLKCWGRNIYGQLGLGDASNRGDGANEMGDNLPAVDLGTGKTAVSVAAAERHTCALLDGGAAKCWGENDAGQLGLGGNAMCEILFGWCGAVPGSMGDNLPAVDLGNGSLALGIDLGDYHTCAIVDTGVVKCWGNNSYGQLGLGDTTSVTAPGNTTKLYSDMW